MARAILRNSFGPGAILGNSFISDTADTELPVLVGSPTIGQKTASMIPYSIPTGTDNVGVAAYDIRIDGGAWTPIGLFTDGEISGLTADTDYELEFTARDAAGNRSDPPIGIVARTYPLGATGQAVLDDTGPVADNGEGIMYSFVEAGYEDYWFYFIVRATPAGGTLDADPNGQFVAQGPTQSYFIADVYRNDELLGQFIGYMYQTEKRRVVVFS